MRRVVIESPFSGDIQRNIDYAKMCVRDSLSRGEAPIASHLLFTQPGILNDNIQEERFNGMRAGWAWIKSAECVVVYQDLGISGGMASGIAVARHWGVPIEYRNIL